MKGLEWFNYSLTLNDCLLCTYMKGPEGLSYSLPLEDGIYPDLVQGDGLYSGVLHTLANRRGYFWFFLLIKIEKILYFMVYQLL